jgi:hypothetical protein
LIDWANEQHLIDDCPQLRAYLARMSSHEKAPPRIAEAFTSPGQGMIALAAVIIFSQMDRL